jgi:hypothetical protein
VEIQNNALIYGETLYIRYETAVTTSASRILGVAAKVVGYYQQQPSPLFGSIILRLNGDVFEETTTTFHDYLYKGQIINGLPDGQGVLYRCSDLSIDYEGSWKNGLKHGQGTSYNNDGREMYVGFWKKDNYSGMGILHAENGSWREGTWKDGKLNGPGIAYDHMRQITYTGTFENDRPKGKLTSVHHDIVTHSQWDNGQKLSDHKSDT